MLNNAWSDHYVYPNYGESSTYGTTIANIPATIGKLFDVGFNGLPPLPQRCWEPLLAKGPISRVVLFIVDAMGHHFTAPGERSPLWDELAQRAHVSEKITSVFPSTTVNALSTIWTGHTPGQHGLVALNLLDPRLNAVNMMIHWRPASMHGYKDTMQKAGVDAENYLPVPGLAEQFNSVNIPTIDIKGREIVYSALSRMHGRGVSDRVGVLSYVELMYQVRKTLEKTSGPCLIMSYWPTIDTMSHFYGPRHPVVARELDSIMREVKESILDGLSEDAARETAFLIVADHGQCEVNHDRSIHLNHYPELEAELTLTAAGEARLPYLYVRHGGYERVKEILDGMMDGEDRTLSRDDLLNSGLLGSTPYHPPVANRVGDINFFMPDAGLWISDSRESVLTKMRGMHGSLMPAEMEVPFWGFRLDDM